MWKHKKLGKRVGPIITHTIGLEGVRPFGTVTGPTYPISGMVVVDLDVSPLGYARRKLLAGSTHV